MNVLKGTTELPTTIDEDESIENFYMQQVLKLSTFASISSILANILISVTIIKYKNLRRSVTNCIILQIVLVQIVSLILDEVLLWFFTHFGTPLPQYHTEFCVSFVGVRVMNAISFLFMILLVCNWYLKLFCNESQYARFSKYHKFVLILIYCVSILSFPFLTRMCLTKDLFATFYVVLSFQVTLIAFTVYMNVAGRCKSRNSFESDTGLGVANITIIFCTPAYVFVILAYYGLVPLYVVLFADILAIGVFPFILLYIYKYDKNFQMYFKRLCFCHKANAESGSVSYNLIRHVET